ncbi:MAG: hypothetical protein GQ476_03080 [Candidatus Aminicenantes bacterium]|jgi:hypothetical protein|nr:hypothetical protein [Candidatus Aminicenantes bacterium]
MKFSICGKNSHNIERLAVEDYLGLEKEEIGTLSSQLNKALLDWQKGLGMAITPRGDLRGDFFVSGKVRRGSKFDSDFFYAILNFINSDNK